MSQYGPVHPSEQTGGKPPRPCFDWQLQVQSCQTASRPSRHVGHLRENASDVRTIGYSSMHLSSEQRQPLGPRKESMQFLHLHAHSHVPFGPITLRLPSAHVQPHYKTNNYLEGIGIKRRTSVLGKFQIMHGGNSDCAQELLVTIPGTFRQLQLMRVSNRRTGISIPVEQRKKTGSTLQLSRSDTEDDSDSQEVHHSHTLGRF